MLDKKRFLQTSSSSCANPLTNIGKHPDYCHFVYCGTKSTIVDIENQLLTFLSHEVRLFPGLLFPSTLPCSISIAHSFSYDVVQILEISTFNCVNDFSVLVHKYFIGDIFDPGDSKHSSIEPHL